MYDEIAGVTAVVGSLIWLAVGIVKAARR